MRSAVCSWFLLLSSLLLSIAPAGRAAEGPPSITTQPAGVTVLQGLPATFGVVVDGTMPLTYQWLRNEAVIASATNSSYSISETAATDNNAAFSVLVTNAMGYAVSSNATLRIDPGMAGLIYTQTLINLSTQIWRYETNGLDLGASWRLPGYDDSTWPSGQALLGVESTMGSYSEPFRSIFPAYSQATITYYFRGSFLGPTGSVVGASLNVTSYVDDGAVFYLNGTEIGRVRMPTADPTYLTTATREITTEGTADVFAFPTTALSPGTNVLAAEVHQFNAGSNDIVFGMRMSATVTNRAPDSKAPTVRPLSPLPGELVQSLAHVEVLFSEPVQGVDASDLLVNGTPATDLTFGAPGQFVFEFAPAPTGTVMISFASGHGITDLAAAPNPFAGSNWTYTVNPHFNPGAFRITEFLASNSKGIRDEDGDRVDWIEIYNPSTTASLQDWALTDDPLNLAKWKFPYYVLDAKSYLLVYASGKNRTNTAPGAKLHTSFGIGAGGGFLALVDPNTNIISVFNNPYPAQSADISYGRDLINPEIVGFYSTPTPGAANSTLGSGIAPEVQFSLPSRTFLTSSPFPLALSTPGFTNATIYYALGTNLPGTNSFRYTNALTLTNTTFLRVRAFVPGLLPGPITTQSYIALTNLTNVVGFNAGLPIVILHNNGGGPVPSSTDQPLFIQTFEPDSGRSSMTNLPNLTGRGVFHLRGSSTLGYAKGSFLLEFRDEANNDKKVPFLGLPEESDWVLYAPNNFEPALVHNPLAHAWYRDMGHYGSRTRFVIVYLKDDAGTPGPVTDADYNGIYVLEEKIKRGKDRVDIDRLDPEDLTVPFVTGGYIFAIDRVPPGEVTLSAGGANLVWIEPSYAEMIVPARAPQVTYIQSYLNSFGAALNGVNWTNPVNGYAAYIDVESWIDLHIHETLTFNVDGLRLSGYLYKPRSKRIHYGPTWDYDRTQGSADGRDSNPRTWRSQSGDLGTDFFNFMPWWGRLFQAPDFWQAWIDRYQELREGTNVLTTNNINAHIQRFYDQLVQAQPRELVRWGVQPRGAGGTGAGTFATETQWKRNWYSNRCDFADKQFLAKPSFSVPPGELSRTLRVTITPVAGLGDRRANSQLFVSLDGTDPRLSGGAIATGPNILSNSGPITVTISKDVRLFARCRNTAHANLTGANNPPISSPWSGPAVGTYSFPAQTPPLRITEIMYHPPKAPPGNATNDADNFEYVEFKNTSGAPLNVTGYRLRGGVSFDFPALTLAAGQACVVVADLTGFQSRYGSGMLIAGSYTNNPGKDRLGNSGDHLKLEGFYHEPILDFDYSDSWYPTTDGAGFALQIVNDNAAADTWGLKESWRPSGSPLGTPGANDAGASTVLPVVINEILTHTDPPQVDAIEIYNPTASPASIGGWFLTDNFNAPKKYRIADGVSVPANDYLVFYADTSFGISFELSSRGEEIYLFSGDGTNLTGYVHGFDFGAQANGVTFGRYLASTGIQYPAQSSPTLGGANAGPQVGPIVISEIMYHPPDISTVEGPRDNNRDEYIELENIAGTPQPLYDPLSPTNTWRVRDAVSFTFPTNVSIPVGGHVLLVSFDPLTDPLAELSFRARNGVFGGTPIFGPYDGQLDNSGDAVELARPDRPQPPDAPDAGAVYYILVDKVNYSDNAPWDSNADGIGLSLQRIVPGGFGNEATNWIAGLKTPGYSGNSGNGPVFIQQPQSLSVLETLPAMFSATATGAPALSYLWFLGNTGFPDATNRIYIIPSVTPADAGIYRCLVQNAAGATFSSNATLTVIAPRTITPGYESGIPGSPSVTSQPQSQTVLGDVGLSRTFSVTASGDAPLTYRWLYGSSVIADATNATLILTNIHVSQQGFYRCIVVNAIGYASSGSALLTVLQPAQIFLQPTNIEIRVRPDPSADVAPTTNATFVMIASSTSPPLTFQWRMNGTNILPSLHYSDVNAASLIISNVTMADFGDYSCALTDPVGTILSSTATLYPLVRPTIQIPFLNQTQVVVAGRPFPVSAVLSNGWPPPFGYQWRSSGSFIVTNLVSNSKTNFFVYPASAVSTNAATGALYRLVVTNRAAPTVLINTPFYITTLLDSDHDGIPDSVESALGLNPSVAADALLDLDGDGMSNLAEYQAGTDPANVASYLRIEHSILPGTATLSLAAVSNRTYTIQFSGSLGAASWSTLADFVAFPTNRVEIVIDYGWTTNRFYRVATPRQP